MPRRKRHNASCGTRPKAESSPVQATQPLATAPKTMRKHVAKNVHLRPSQSPKTPKDSWPMMAPTSVALAMMLFACDANPPGCNRCRIEITKSITNKS